jgi:prolyl-tRNA synthetase
MSHLFGQTLRDAPAEAEVASHQLLVRAGFIRQLGAGIFSYLPLARRSLTKIENIMRQEINAIGGQEVTMPVIHPAEVWKETGRWYQIGAEMGRFLDKAGRDMVLAMTHEEVVADLVRREVQSYRQLPMLVYHIQTKWRDDPRPRAGLIRVREFTMLDSYSLDADAGSLDRQYRAHYQAYFNIFNRCGLPTIAVASDVGMMGGSLAHEFMYLTPVGEDTLLLCRQCGYSANRQVATFRKPPAAPEAPRPTEEVATPGVTTIDALVEFLGIPKARTAKAVFMVATRLEDGQEVDRLVFALVRGDMDVNETKLANALGAKELRPAREDEITAVGAVAGYGSPVGLAGQSVLVVVDDAIPQSPNLVGGANRAGFHLRHVNYGRDYQAALVADIAAAGEGDGCPQCGAPLRVSRGVEVGNIFKLGTRYTSALGANFLDQTGKMLPVIMGSYGIGSGRLLACVAEAHHDADGLCWPITVAPFQVQLTLLPEASGQAQREAEALYATLTGAGVEVLFDDRDERPGVKFKDADLLGLPLRLTVSERSLKQGGAELKHRGDAERALVPLAEVEARVRNEIERLYAAIAAGVVPVTYPEA